MEVFNPKVSIAIPVYNGSNYLREAIDSALAQTYKNCEIIVVNDGSTDNTEEIALSYGSKIRYYAKKNGGTSTALNLGIAKMEGEYFSWLSHDDMYYPNKIKREMEELKDLENKNTIIMTDLDGINENYEKIYITNYINHIKSYQPREKSFLHPIIYNQTHGCTLLISKKIFDEIGLFDETSLVAQDFELFYRAFKKFPHQLISEVLVTARDSSNRQGRRSKAMGSNEYSDLFIKIIEEFNDDDFRLLAPTKLDFYEDMLDFYAGAGYDKAYNYISKKVIKNIQISSYDLVGNKFNGYDLHLDLREKNVSSTQLVLYKESNDNNTHIYNFLSANGTKNIFLLKKFIMNELIHLHLIHNIFDLNYLPLLTKLKPTIITLHDPYFLGGHCVHHFDCPKWQTHCYDCQYLDKPFVTEQDTVALNFELKKQTIQNSQITAIVASRWMEEKVKKSPIWQGKKVYFLPFGINQDLFKLADIQESKKKLGISPASFTVMFRSDPSPYKGLDLIIDSLMNLEFNSNTNPTILSVAQKGLLGKLSEKYTIIEYDWITDDNILVELYQACDIFLMPSRQETFGMMAIEAMSCGKMVLAINSTALPDVINAPVCGVSVEESAYAVELQRLVNNPQEIIERGKKSYEFAKQNYNKDTYVDKMITIYKEVIAEHKVDVFAQLVTDQLLKHQNTNNMISDYEAEKTFSKHHIKEIAEFQNFSWPKYLDIFTDEWIKEEKGVWLRQKGSIQFVLEKYPQRPVLLIFAADPLVHDELQPKVTVSIYVNQCFITEINMYKGTQYEVEIPAELFNKKEVIISFESTNAKSPKELCKWDFEDKLAFFMYSFSLVEIGTTIQTKYSILQEQFSGIQMKHDDIMLLHDKLLNSKAVRLSNKIKKIIGKPLAE